MNEVVTLQHFDNAKREIALANTIDEVKQIRDQAEALRQYIRQQGASLEMQNHAAEIKLRAERRAGEMLKETEKNPGNLLRGNTMQPREETPTLEELGISKIQSHRWQLEAEIPEEKFEQFIAETKAASEELTSRAALSIAARIRNEKKKETTSDTTIPNGLFDVIVIDPPWPYGGQYSSTGHRVASPYPEMPIEEIIALDIPAADNCILWLWTTNRFMHEAHHILEAWAFEPKTILTWFKMRTGVGHWLRGDTEHCILAVRGSPKITHTSQSTALMAKATDHSRKPDDFLVLVESLCPGAKLEMFARKKREGWESWGNQIGTMG